MPTSPFDFSGLTPAPAAPAAPKQQPAFDFSGLTPAAAAPEENERANMAPSRVETQPAKKLPGDIELPADTTPRYGLRPDGTKKGKGFLGPLKRPDGMVMSEYSIADS